MFRHDFQALARTREREARHLYRAGCFDGAYYLAGLAVECAFKACVARQTRRFEFPDRRRAENAHTHRLEQLLNQAELASAMANASLALRESWATVKDWTVEIRYSSGRSGPECRDFLASAFGRQGLLPWLRRRW